MLSSSALRLQLQAAFAPEDALLGEGKSVFHGTKNTVVKEWMKWSDLLVLLSSIITHCLIDNFGYDSSMQTPNKGL